MEFYIFFGLLIVGAIYLLWRTRRSTTDWRESPNAGQPHDRTDQIAFPTDPEYDAAKLAAMRSRPVSREEGHGKDGGG
jgi:heme-degrading monooxygenase HmoA